MKTYRIVLDVVVAAKSERKAEKLADRMLDAVEDELVSSTADIHGEDVGDE